MMVNRLYVFSLLTALSAPFLAGAETPAPAATATPAPAATTAATAAEPAAANPQSRVGTASALGPVTPDIARRVDPNTLPALRNILKPGTEARYLGNEYGLKAYMLINGADITAVYLTPDEQGFLIGALFSADGMPTTVLQLARTKQAGFDIERFADGMTRPRPPEIPQPAVIQPLGTMPGGMPGIPNFTTTTSAPPGVSPGEVLFSELSSASWIAYGPPTAPMVTAFMDPHCKYCHNAFKILKPLADAGKLYMRVIPVSVLKPDEGRQIVVNALSSPVPADAWQKVMFDEDVPPAAQINPEAGAALDANQALVTRWQIPGTPYFVYRAKDSKVKILYGAPDEMKDMRADLGVE